MIELITASFNVCHPADPAAGIHGFDEEVKVAVNGEYVLGGPENLSEFTEHIESMLAEWFDGAKVTLANRKYEEIR